MNNFIILLKLLTRPKRLRSILSFEKKGYLHEIGWFNSFEINKPIDFQGNPVPWVTYSFIDFIKPRIKKQHRIFEFGPGNSTYFYASFAGSVMSVEHDIEWYEKIVDGKPQNAEIIYCELHKDGKYCRTPSNLGEKFDLIIVDGRDRVNCCKQAVEALNSRGVIVLDDSERVFYEEGIQFLLEQGFKQLPFSGISPGLFYLKTTSIFYKTDNCLDI